ncbi:MAG: hypothetical protein U9Q69_03480 [Nanoarchaeota archaeon]|nr:hypothetical protein [Nanoarchaeota archaeon]
MTKLIYKIASAIAGGAMAITSSSCIKPNGPSNHRNGKEVPAYKAKKFVDDAERIPVLQILPHKSKLESLDSLDRFMLSRDMGTYFSAKGTNALTYFVNNAPEFNAIVKDKIIQVLLPDYQSDGNTYRRRIDNKTIYKGLMEKDLKQSLKDAAEMDMFLFKHFSKDVKNKKGNRLGKNFNQRKDFVVAKGITAKMLTEVPNLTPDDFLPELLIYGNVRSALGVSQIDSGRIVYASKGRLGDEINGFKATLAHEMIHNNSKIQRFPSLLNMPVEQFASIAQAYFQKDSPLDFFLFHPYAASYRLQAKIYKNVDSSKQFKKLIEYSIINFHKFQRGEYNKIVKKNPALMDFLAKNMVRQAYPEYFANEPWWMLATNYAADEELVIDVMFAAKNKPQVLNAKKKQAFWKKKKAVFEQILKDTWNAYRPPRVYRRGSFVFKVGLSLPMTFISKCRKRGFKNDETLFAYHHFLKRSFTKNGKMNYGSLDVDDLLSRWESGIKPTMKKYKKYFNSKLPKARKQRLDHRMKLFEWYMARLKGAVTYARFGSLEGKSDMKFKAGTFDPYKKLHKLYKFLPEYAQDYHDHKKLLKGYLFSKRKKIGNQGFLVRYYDLHPQKGYSSGIDLMTFIKIKKDGTLESKVTSLFFASKNSKEPDTFALDSDKEGTPGHGIFDSIVSYQHLFNNFKKVLAEKKPWKKTEGKFPIAQINGKPISAKLIDTNMDFKKDTLMVISEAGNKTISQYYHLPNNERLTVVGNNVFYKDGANLITKSLETFVHEQKPFMVVQTEDGESQALLDSNNDGIMDTKLE